MYPHRPKVEAFDSVVDVIELLLILIDQAPKARHLQVQHMFNSMTSLEIQQSVEEVDEIC